MSLQIEDAENQSSARCTHLPPLRLLRPKAIKTPPVLPPASPASASAGVKTVPALIHVAAVLPLAIVPEPWRLLLYERIKRHVQAFGLCWRSAGFPSHCLYPVIPWL